ncbi:beta-ketoacyl-ACP synthase III [Hespellia stercorisuis]|uniref:Beta-ketoacyl-[acyl-carrier-protein] synthase III n=1 Tax=Hespellia stercorisuis DSM 15480 TaxID=1121950 RepID=A0A1M6LC80_9FIRM|nr:beta-ketoacyl-ACP synthase III [Hespellia stercorisuis]SHJ68796.1 3-oxoacyl-[acyl-carrier-protein] synthase-3 [Hespellia stercorisuis DSM 15480]
MIGKIRGTGSFVPPRTLDNNDLSGMVETNDAWIRERTGVVRRHIIEEDNTVSMAVKAARNALENSRIAPEEIDLIIVSTISSNVVLPCAACEVQKEIGAVNATCFDLNAACTGFVFAYNTAQAYIAGGIYKTVLIIGAESLSNLVDWRDRGTCILFGDGAGAAILQTEEGESFPVISHSDGTKGGALTCESRHTKVYANLSGIEKKDITFASGDPTYMHMDGQAVFKFAVRKVPEAVNELLAAAQLETEDIDYFLLHQANKRIVEAVAKRLHTGIEKFPMNLDEYGNTSSASIAILLDEMNRSGKLIAGQKLVMTGFGAGLSWGASLLVW